jgi:hypothetical protein
MARGPNGWSRAVLLNQIKSRLPRRVGATPTNFPATVPAADTDLARQVVKDRRKGGT